MRLEDMWVFSDTHFGHRNVLKPTYDNRPFPTIEEHDEVITQNTLDTLPRGAILQHLGDVSMSHRHSVPFLEAMKAHGVVVHLIRGNHDKDTIKKHGHYFKTVHDVMYLSGYEVGIFLSHYGHRVWPWSNNGSIHLHGHSHGNLPRIGRSRDMCVTMTDYRPVNMAVVVRELLQYEYTNQHPEKVDQKHEAYLARIRKAGFIR